MQNVVAYFVVLAQMDVMKPEPYKVLLQIAGFVAAGLIGAWIVSQFWRPQGDDEASRLRDEKLAEAEASRVQADQRAHALEEDNLKLRLDLDNAVQERDKLRRENIALSVQLAERGNGTQNRPDSAEVTAVRSITPEQARQVSAELEQFKGTWIEIWQLEDPEAAALAREIVAVLTAAKWMVKVTRFGALNPPRYGVICVHPGNPAARAFVKSLNSIHMVATERLDPNGFVIIVGLKPPAD